MSKTFNFSLSRATALFAASLLIIASASLGGFYGYTAGNRVHFALGIVLAAAAVAGEILKPISVAAAFDAFARNAYGRMSAAIALATVCLLYSAAAELNFAATIRGDQTAERAALAGADGGARKRVEAELQSLAPSRPTAELEPLIAAQRALTRGADCSRWSSSSAARTACSELAQLSSELGRTKHREYREKALRDSLDRAGAPIGAADPLAAAIANYANAVGRKWAAEAVSPWLALIPVAFLEIASALALIVARSVAHNAEPGLPEALARHVAGAPAASKVSSASTVAPALAKPPATPVELAAQSPGTALPAHVETVTRLLDQHRGRLSGSQRTLARLAGLPKTSFGRAVRALADAGTVRVQARADGTEIERCAA